MSNRPKFPPSQPTISINNLPALEELSESEASKIAGGSNPRPGGGSDPCVLNEPAHQISSISLLGIGFNHNTTMISAAELKSDSLSIENLTPFEELSESEATKIAGGGDPRPGGSGDPNGLNEPAHQISSISLLTIRYNHNTTIVNAEDFNL
ncbi:MAG: hypothetical protein AB4372_20640 [Xenococcus sp. (in: cyanobacteria)]